LEDEAGRRKSRYHKEEEEEDEGRYRFFMRANELMLKPNMGQTKARW